MLLQLQQSFVALAWCWLVHACTCWLYRSCPMCLFFVFFIFLAPLFSCVWFVCGVCACVHNSFWVCLMNCCLAPQAVNPEWLEEQWKLLSVQPWFRGSKSYTRDDATGELREAAPGSPRGEESGESRKEGGGRRKEEGEGRKEGRGEWREERRNHLEGERELSSV